MKSLRHNLLLESLPADLRSTLLSYMETVELPLRTVLFEADTHPRYVHFLLSGVASLVVILQTGEVVEVGLTGCEGFPEKVHLLGPKVGVTRCFMQVPGVALRMDFERFRAEFHRNPELMRSVHRYVQYYALMLAQLGACNRLHEVEQRLARWLLMFCDHAGGQDLRLTQEFVGEMLGARRSSINLAAGNLQRAGHITYSRGKIRVRDRKALESAACECYAVISGLHRDLYP